MKESTLELTGPIRFQTISPWVKRIHRFVEDHAQSDRITIDCTQVAEVDTSVVALLLMMIRLTKQHEQTLQLQAVPGAAMELATLYRVKDMISAYVKES